jgi:hypothetical protein
MPGKLVEVRAVRIICDVVLRERVVKELDRLGAPGHTAWSAYGHGTVQDIGWPETFASPNRVFLEVWCRESVADQIVGYCQSSKFEGIGMIAGVHPIWIHEDEAAKLGHA